MHILSIVGTFPQLSETFIWRKAVALARRGHRVHVMARQWGDRSLIEETGENPGDLVFSCLPPDWGWSRPARVWGFVRRAAPRVARRPLAAARLLRSGAGARGRALDGVRRFVRYVGFLGVEADVVHFEFLGLAGVYPQIRQVVRAPVVVSCRGSEIHLLEQQPPEQREALLECIRSAGAVHCVSDAIAQAVSRVSGRVEGVWVNRPAVDVDAIAPPARRDAAGPPRVVAVGRLVWIKGYDYLLAALARLKRDGVAFRAEIVGDGPLRDALRFSIADLGLEGDVEMTGALPPSAVVERLARADLFVLSSHQEGISNAALEALAAGLPVVTTAAGGMVEVVRDGVEGFVVPVRDVPALAARLRTLLEDPELRLGMGRAARARAEAEFSLERQARVFESLYESVVGPGRDGARRGGGPTVQRH